MLRRQAIASLIAAFSRNQAGGRDTLAPILHADNGAAVLLDVRTRHVIAANDTSITETFLAPPGSTIKPLVLSTLLSRGLIRPNASFHCPTRLTIGNRRFDCTHPPLASAMRIDTAIAYSCNCFVAHFAERFDRGQLAMELRNGGLARVQPAASADAQRVQALGDGNVLTSAAELAFVYRQLAVANNPLIVAGLEGAVEFGTAQNARIERVTIAGKTGTVRTTAGARVAWFAGFMPSRAPEVVVTVMLAGRSGGADAAPVAREILEARRAKRI